MSKKPTKEPENTLEHPLPESYKAVAVFKIDTYLNQAVEITVENGVVTNIHLLTPAPDLPAQVIGQASKVLWKNLYE